MSDDFVVLGTLHERIVKDLRDRLAECEREKDRYKREAESRSRWAHTNVIAALKTIDAHVRVNQQLRAELAEAESTNGEV